MPHFGMCNGQRRVPLFLVQGIEEGHLPCLHLYKCQVQTLHNGPSFNPHPQSSVHQTPVFHPILRGTPLSLHPIQRYRNAWGVFLMNMNGCPAPDFLNLLSLSSFAMNSSLPLPSSSSAAFAATAPSTQAVPVTNLLKPTSPIPSASHLSATSPPVSSLSFSSSLSARTALLAQTRLALSHARRLSSLLPIASSRAPGERLSRHGARPRHQIRVVAALLHAHASPAPARQPYALQNALNSRSEGGIGVQRAPRRRFDSAQCDGIPRIVHRGAAPRSSDLHALHPVREVQEAPRGSDVGLGVFWDVERWTNRCCRRSSAR